MSRPVSITLQDCESLYYLPVAQAAQVLGVSRPTISKVLRANGIKRWPYRKLRAEGKIDALRTRREEEALLPANFPVLPPLPPPLPQRIDDAANYERPVSAIQNHNHSVRSEPLFQEPETRQIRDDETYILHLLDRPISPQQFEDHTHPLLTLATEPEWTCNEQLTGDDVPLEDDTDRTESPPSPDQPAKKRIHQQFHPKKRTHTTCTVRPVARALFGAANWSRGVFQQNGERESFAFLPPMPFGSSLSEDDPLDDDAGNGG